MLEWSLTTKPVHGTSTVEEYADTEGNWRLLIEKQMAKKQLILYCDPGIVYRMTTGKRCLRGVVEYVDTVSS